MHPRTVVLPTVTPTVSGIKTTITVIETAEQLSEQQVQIAVRQRVRGILPCRTDVSTLPKYVFFNPRVATTICFILGALDVPTEGTVLTDGVDIATLSEAGLADLRNRVVGFVFQFPYLLNELSCLENVLTPITISRGEASETEKSYVSALLDRVGLAEQIHKHPDTMIGGQNQRCAIIRALANQPKIVLADEPTGNLDSRSGNGSSTSCAR